VSATTTNTAVANATSTQTGLAVRSLPAQATVNITTPMAPGDMRLAKSANPISGRAPLAVTYTYTLLNDGTDPLFHTAVADNACGPVTLQSGDTNNNQLLDPGETWTWRCQTTLNATTTNTAQANATSTQSGFRVMSNRAEATVTVNSP